MKKILIHMANNAQQKDCTIFVGTGFLDQIDKLFPINAFTKSVIVTGDRTPTIFIKKVCTSIPHKYKVITVTTGEKHKSLDSVKKIWETLHDFDCDRKSLVINLGGGFITDIGGFSASTYLKGVNFLNIPTTLLGQVDAAIGGKLGINFDGVKNLIGTYQSPIGVIADISCLSTLPKRELVSGFGEIIKHGLICDQNYFVFSTSKKPKEFTEQELMRIVERSCEIKAQIVAKDVKEIGTGKILNFGHTVSRVIEAFSQESAQPILHGEAVLWGMMVETKISFLLGLLSKKESELILRKLSTIDLPKLVENISISILYKTLQSNNVRGKLYWTLLKGIGQAVINKKVTGTVIMTALQQMEGKLT